MTPEQITKITPEKIKQFVGRIGELRKQCRNLVTVVIPGYPTSTDLLLDALSVIEAQEEQIKCLESEVGFLYRERTGRNTECSTPGHNLDRKGQHGRKQYP